MIAIVLIALAAGSASALMFASIISGALISLVLFYLAPLPLMVAAIGWGPLSAAIGGISATIGLGVLFAALAGSDSQPGPPGADQGSDSLSVGFAGDPVTEAVRTLEPSGVATRPSRTRASPRRRASPATGV